MTSQKKVVVVDYGMGNLWSVKNALLFVGADVTLSSNPLEIVQADAIVLPGVGSFSLAMQALSDQNLDAAIHEVVVHKQRKILGICLGFQMLGTSSTEGGLTSGLGFIRADVDSFSKDELNGLKVPHIGFNKVLRSDSGVLFNGCRPEEDFYFVHSYRMVAEQLPGHVSLCHYGIDFIAAYEHENVFGAQFHPEKSQTNGLRVLLNFLRA